MYTSLMAHHYCSVSMIDSVRRQQNPCSKDIEDEMNLVDRIAQAESNRDGTSHLTSTSTHSLL